MELAASGLAARQSGVENTASADGFQSALPCPFVVVVVRGCGVGLLYAHPPPRPQVLTAAANAASRSPALRGLYSHWAGYASVRQCPPRRRFLSSTAKARADRSSAHALPMRLAAPEP